MPARSSKPRFVGQNRQLSRLVAQVDELNRLLATVRGTLPPALAATCIAVALENGVLQVGVTSSAAAARLKLSGEAIVQAVCQAGWHATAIRPRVQVELRQQKAIRTKDLSIPAAAVEAFGQLAERLDAGPLREAVLRLAKRHGGR